MTNDKASIQLSFNVLAADRKRIRSNITTLKEQCLSSKIEYDITEHAGFIAGENVYTDSSYVIKLTGDLSCIGVLQDFIRVSGAGK